MTTENIFSGLKVVDLSSFIAGPSAAVILSDFGADVIKVEPPTVTHGESATSFRRSRDPTTTTPGI
jgi:crotonobetainyl-CoA:carnitine CoA-transferase CaiB-like acyl-CoA transferase